MKLSILKDLLKLETPYIDSQTLRNMLSGYRNPKDYIWRLVKSGELVRLKNGFFLIRYQADAKAIPIEQIANLLYGPSYVSLEYALAFYGIIPEAAYVCTSMTTKRIKHFYTEIGVFSYFHLEEDRYSIGIAHKENQIGGFSLATPEKALADHLFRLGQHLNTSQEILTDLIESKRIELSTLKNLDKRLMQEISSAYRSKVVKLLADLIQSL